MIPSGKHGNLIKYAGDSYIAAAYGASDLIVYGHWDVIKFEGETNNSCINTYLRK